ncbi:MAG: hypothetical protein J2P24_19910 [Streptosporangiales bacterium]|nr:hypothetical protein [Streptosporangiales bacterium]
MSIRRGRRRTSAGNGWQRFRRWAGLDGNPLRRRTDRLQCWMRLAALVFVLAGLVLTGVVSRATYAAEVSLQHANARVGYRTTGHVLSSGDADISPDGTVLGGMIRVSWRDHAGHTRVQLLVAPTAASSLTDSIPLWVDARGKASASPPDPDKPVTAAVMTGFLGCGVAVTAAVVLYLLALVPVERRRLKEWQLEWSVVEPGWRRQAL